jgi:undecaprenyl-diphosphatase
VIKALTHLGGAPATIAIGLALLAANRHTGLAALLGNVISHIIVQVLKRSVARSRPCDPSGRSLALVAAPDPFSFPSGHSAAAFAVAVASAADHPWVSPLALPLAGLVAASRVWLRVHHVGDVVAGAALGCLGALAAAAVLS